MARLPGKADAVIGMRRVGKTSLLFHDIQARLAGGVGRERILYVNFEDERLFDLDAAELHELTDALYRRSPGVREAGIFLYLDEVQNVASWERFVRRILDEHRAVVTVTCCRTTWTWCSSATSSSVTASVGKDTLYASLAQPEDAFMVFTVPIDARSERVRSSNSRKVYPIDPGLATACSFSAARNTGHLLETAVYLQLRRRGYQAAYVQTRSGFEVDFAARRPAQPTTRLVQVCADLSQPGTRDRELRALREAMEEYGVDQGELVTLLDEEVVESTEGTIEVVPAWRWLLDPRWDSGT